MTQLNTDPADSVQYDTPVAAVTAPTDLEKPTYATTDVDPTPGSPRPLAAAEPNYATTDIDPTPGSPRPLAAAEPNYATTDVDAGPGDPRPLAAAEPNFATTDVDPRPGSPRLDEVHYPAGHVGADGVADPAVDTVRPDTGPSRGR